MAVVADVILAGTSAGIPAASSSNDGFLYFETDTQILKRSNGATWVQVANAVGGSAPPSGDAGGVLDGTYPNPDFAAAAAAALPYDNAASGLIATDAQAAVDELSGKLNAGGGTSGGLGDTFLISGGEVEWISGYSFLVRAATYKINGTEHSSAEVTLTCDAADVTDDRIDVIALDDSPAAVLIKGTTATPPNEPVVDPATQLRLTAISVDNGTTEPVTAADVLIYDEGAGGEWTPTASAGSIDPADATNPLNGTICTRATTAPAGTYVKYVAGAAIDVTVYDYLSVPFRVATVSNNRGVYVTLWLAGVRKGLQLTIANGYWNLSTANTTDYQRVLIPVAAFGLASGQTVDEVRLTGFGGTTSWAVDVIRWVANGGSVVVSGGGGMTQAEADARYFQIANNLSEGVAATMTSRFSNFVGDSGGGGTKGLVPGPAAGDAAAGKYLAAGGGWSTPSGTGAPSDAAYLTAQAEDGLSAEVNLGALTTGMLKHTVAGGVSTPATASAGTDYAGPPDGTTLEDSTGSTRIKDAGVTNAKMANMTAKTFKGRHTNSTGAPEDVAASDVLADIAAAPIASPTFTGTTTAPEFSVSGLTGAATASRYVGGVAGAAPTSGTFAVGDFVVDTTLGGLWTCTVAGTPGTWIYAGPSVVINPQTDDYTLVLADAGKLITLSNAGAKTLTIPANGTVAFPVGTVINALQIGAGQYTVAITSDTLSGANGLKCAKQYSMVSLTKIASTTWVLTGDSTT